MTRLYLARHGQVENHHEFRYNGHTDVDITELGLKQMNQLADFFTGKKITALYSSDLMRSVKGVEIIGKALTLSFEKLPELRELHLGRWEGLTRSEAIELYPDEAHMNFSDLAKNKLQGGESFQELSTRVLPVIEKIVKAHAGEEVCIIAHGGVNRIILAEAIGMPLENFFRIEQDYGGLNIIDFFSDGNTVVKMLNSGPNQKMGETFIY